MKQNGKRIASFLLAMVMMLCIVPIMGSSAKADEVENTEAKYKVLYWQITENANSYDIANYYPLVREYYESMEDVSVVTKTNGTLTKEELEGINIVYIINFKADKYSESGKNLLAAASLLKEYAKAGGRVVMNGEHATYSPEGNACFSALAEAMGGNFTITSRNAMDKVMEFNTTDKAELTESLTSDFVPLCYAVVTSTNESAVWVVRSKTDSTAVMVLDQKVENGYLTVFADINWIASGNEANNAQAKQFLRNLLIDSAHNQEVFNPNLTITDPEDVTGLVEGEISGELNVTASVDVEVEYAFTYQWYKNTTDSNEGGELVEGATSETLTIPTDLTAGSYYYYCEVTVDFPGRDHSLTQCSNAAEVQVSTPVEEEPEEEEVIEEEEVATPDEAVVIATETKAESDSVSEAAPKTGDNSGVVLLTLIMLLSAGAMFFSKKNFNK